MQWSVMRGCVCDEGVVWWAGNGNGLDHHTITPSHVSCYSLHWSDPDRRAVAVLERHKERQSDTPPAGSLCSHGGRREVKMEVCPTAEYLDFRFISLSFSIFEKI